MAYAAASDSYFDELIANAWLKAFAISLVLHLTLLGAYKAIERPEFKEKAKDLFPSLQLTALEEKLAQQQAKTEREIPMTFVYVDPAAAAEAPPKETKFYGAVDSVASNPEEKIESALPNIEITPKPAPEPAPAPPKAEPLQPTVPPEPSTPSELALAEALPPPVQSKGEAAPAPRAPLPKQDGGVKRRALIQSFDVKATPFGTYDAAFIAAVQKEWDTLLEGRNTTASGKVVVEFHLMYDGRIVNLEVVESEVDDFLVLLCKKAITDPAPYPRWPIEMRRQLRVDSRYIVFTFHYLGP